MAADVQDSVAEHRVGQQPDAAELDQDRGVSDEGDPIARHR
jgi:hypothetical protein